MNLNVENFGQVFTPFFIVSTMINLIKNHGNILEPSSGNGSFSKVLQHNNITSIEIDPRFNGQYDYINIDFFDYPIINKFDTIIGNPPYVRYQDIDEQTKIKLKNKEYFEIFDNRSNLYLFFIYKCITHLNTNGELIFITPRDFLKATSAIKLNQFIYEHGTITHIIELGDKKIFQDASPNTIIWRFEKNNFKRETNIKQNFICNMGQLLFTNNRYPLILNEIAFVKVGAVSGSDKCFEHEDGIDFVCSYTQKTQKTKKMIYNKQHPFLNQYKDILIQRKIRKFNELNWFEWGRKYFETNLQRLYVNNKTRAKKPFFESKINAYDGSILAIFPRAKLTPLQLRELCSDLNKVCWEELGFVVDGRYIFNQKSLENSMLPINFSKYLPTNKDSLLTLMEE